MTDDEVWIYHEKQEALLCGQHALNNLAQTNKFTPYQLANIAHQLDELELNVFANNNEGGRSSKDYQQRLAEGSHHVDERGNFSIEVLKAALQNEYHIAMVMLKTINIEITTVQGFLCHKSDHWFAIRNIGGRFWNLNSVLERPTVISHFQLAKEMQQWQVKDGYTVFCIESGLPKRAVSTKDCHKMSDLLQGKSTAEDPWSKLSTGGMRLDGGTTKTNASSIQNHDHLTEDEALQLALQQSLEQQHSQRPSLPTIQVPPEPAAGTPHSTRIQFKLPNTKTRIVRRFLKTDSVQVVVAFCESLQNEKVGVILKVGFPPRDLVVPASTTIEQAKLSNETIQVRYN